MPNIFRPNMFYSWKDSGMKKNLKIQMNWKNWNLRCIHKDRRSLRRTKGIRLFDRTIGQDNSGNSRYSLQPALRKKE